MGNSMSKVLATAALLAASHLHHAYLGSPGSINDGNQVPMDNHVFSRHLSNYPDQDAIDEEQVEFGLRAFRLGNGVNVMPASIKGTKAGEKWMEGFEEGQRASDLGKEAAGMDKMPPAYEQDAEKARIWKDIYENPRE